MRFKQILKILQLRVGTPQLNMRNNKLMSIDFVNRVVCSWRFMRRGRHRSGILKVLHQLSQTLDNHLNKGKDWL